MRASAPRGVRPPVVPEGATYRGGQLRAPALRGLRLTHGPPIPHQTRTRSRGIENEASRPGAGDPRRRARAVLRSRGHAVPVSQRKVNFHAVPNVTRLRVHRELVVVLGSFALIFTLVQCDAGGGGGRPVGGRQWRSRKRRYAPACGCSRRGRPVAGPRSPRYAPAHGHLRHYLRGRPETGHRAPRYAPGTRAPQHVPCPKPDQGPPASGSRPSPNFQRPNANCRGQEPNEKRPLSWST